jgi:hypothetical protein
VEEYLVLFLAQAYAAIPTPIRRQKRTEDELPRYAIVWELQPDEGYSAVVGASPSDKRSPQGRAAREIMMHVFFFRVEHTPQELAQACDHLCSSSPSFGVSFHSG